MRSLTKRQFLGAAITACTALPLAQQAGAQPQASAESYPSRTVKVIVPYGPGTAPDAIARIVSEALGKRFNQPFVVDNRTGAGGKIGTAAAATSPADGYTLFLGTKDTQSILPFLYPKWTVKPQTELIPLLGLARIQNVLVTRQASSLNNLKDVMNASRQKQLSYGTPGIGTNLHLMGELLAARYDMKLLHVPYSRSFAEALPAVAQGDIDLLIAGLPPTLGMMKDGRVKALAITGTARSPYAPTVPTFEEQGVQGLEVGGWFGLFAPAGVAPDIAAKLTSSLGSILADADVKARLSGLSAEVAPTPPAELADQMRAESQRWGKLIEQLNIQIE